VKSAEDIAILIERMERWLDGQPPGSQLRVNFTSALHALDWVMEREERDQFAIKADALVAEFKKKRRRRSVPKCTVIDDHFAI
jgi:hypothetical protein